MCVAPLHGGRAASIQKRGMRALDTIGAQPHRVRAAGVICSGKTLLMQSSKVAPHKGAPGLFLLSLRAVGACMHSQAPVGSTRGGIEGVISSYP